MPYNMQVLPPLLKHVLFPICPVSRLRSPCPCNQVSDGHPVLLARHMRKLSKLDVARKWALVTRGSKRKPFIPADQPSHCYLPEQCPGYMVADFDADDDNITTIIGKRTVLTGSVNAMTLLLGLFFFAVPVLRTPNELKPRLLRNLATTIVAHAFSGVHRMFFTLVFALAGAVVLAICLPFSLVTCWFLRWPYYWSATPAYVQTQVPKDKSFKVDLVAVPGLASLAGRNLLQPLLDSGMPAEHFAEASIKAHITHRWQSFTSFFLVFELVDRLIYLGLFLVYGFTLRHDGDASSLVPGEACTPPSQAQMVLMGLIGCVSASYFLQELSDMAKTG